jgi:predicted nucleic acid-binding protein
MSIQIITLSEKNYENESDATKHAIEKLEEILLNSNTVKKVDFRLFANKFSHQQMEIVDQWIFDHEKDSSISEQKSFDSNPPKWVITFN